MKLTLIRHGSKEYRQMAVSDQAQGKGAGRKLMEFAEQTARERGFRRITMHARKTAIGFYEKLGYRVEGGEFLEVTLPHVLMTKTLFE